MTPAIIPLQPYQHEVRAGDPRRALERATVRAQGWYDRLESGSMKGMVLTQCPQNSWEKRGWVCDP